MVFFPGKNTQMSGSKGKYRCGNDRVLCGAARNLLSEVAVGVEDVYPRRDILDIVIEKMCFAGRGKWPRLRERGRRR